MTVHDLEGMTQAEFEAARGDIFKALKNSVVDVVETSPAQPRFKIPSTRSVIEPVYSRAQKLENMTQREYEARRGEIMGWLRDGLLHDGRG